MTASKVTTERILFPRKGRKTSKHNRLCTYNVAAFFTFGAATAISGFRFFLVREVLGTLVATGASLCARTGATGAAAITRLSSARLRFRSSPCIVAHEGNINLRLKIGSTHSFWSGNLIVRELRFIKDIRKCAGLLNDVRKHQKAIQAKKSRCRLEGELLHMCCSLVAG